jgi:hypothetical protein
MGEIFWTANKFFARVDSVQGEDGHNCLKPFHFPGPSIFGLEAAQSVHFVEEIHKRAIAKVNDSVGSSVAPRRRHKLRIRMYCRGGRSIQRSVSRVVAGTPCRTAALIPAT